MQSYLLLSLIGLISCGALLVAAQTELNDLLSKLEQFGDDVGNMRSGLTYDHYKIVFNGLNEHFKKIVAKGRPDEGEFLILNDFIVNPMRRFRPSEDDDARTKRAYVNRMERAFKLFYPAYAASSPIGNMRMFNAEKFRNFLNSMQLQGAAPVWPTLAMWQEAIKEHESVQARITEIATHEDIYKHLDELELLWNFINDFDVFYLVQNFADRLNECKSDADLKEIVAEYRMRLSSDE